MKRRKREQGVGSIMKIYLVGKFKPEGWTSRVGNDSLTLFREGEAVLRLTRRQVRSVRGSPINGKCVEKARSKPSNDSNLHFPTNSLRVQSVMGNFRPSPSLHCAGLELVERSHTTLPSLPTFFYFFPPLLTYLIFFFFFFSFFFFLCFRFLGSQLPLLRKPVLGASQSDIKPRMAKITSRG
uniref:Uncharacterized protein n=1 Tax=Trypanosoma vivax (strain Y486) TaxID=1055687 RepID=G0TRV7_TRYVY|nr:hypothetical protein TVY486_0200910 [Trypanosoma vivax Y486]